MDTTGEVVHLNLNFYGWFAVCCSLVGSWGLYTASLLDEMSGNVEFLGFMAGGDMPFGFDGLFDHPFARLLYLGLE